MARRPILYEINTRCWLRELSIRTGRSVSLADVPDSEIASWTAAGFTHVWLMGVWATGPRARQCYFDLPDTRERLSHLLPDWTEADVPGSPYAVAEYRVPDELGGNAGLIAFRQRLHAAGLRLILDFVPNHVGLDDEWVTRRPELLVNRSEPFDGAFRQMTGSGERWIAHGRDPYFPPWTDTAQVDLRTAATRMELIRVLGQVADLCDGVRCDMAMLGLNEVFQKTWRDIPVTEAPAPTEFWEEAIETVRRPGFLFIAEAYWDFEERLLELGFDNAYDKRVLDDLVDRRPAELASRLVRRRGALTVGGVHFLENHDEPRAASRFSFEEHRLAALLMFGLPGLPMLHEGQMTGARVRTPVQLSRRPVEPEDPAIVALYCEMLEMMRRTPVGNGVGRVLPVTYADPREQSEGAVTAIVWLAGEDGFAVVLVNLGPVAEKVLVNLPKEAGPAGRWHYSDFLDERQELIRVGLGADRRLELVVPAQAGQVLVFRLFDQESV